MELDEGENSVPPQVVDSSLLESLGLPANADEAAAIVLGEAQPEPKRFQFVTVEFLPLNVEPHPGNEQDLAQLPEAEVASTAWLIDESNVYWPKYRSTAVFQKLLREHASPTSTDKIQWDTLKCRIIGIPQDTIQRAGMYVTDSDWQPPEETSSNKRTTRGQPPKRLSLYVGVEEGTSYKKRKVPLRRGRKAAADYESDDDAIEGLQDDQGTSFDPPPMEIDSPPESVTSIRLRKQQGISETITNEVADIGLPQIALHASQNDQLNSDNATRASSGPESGRGAGNAQLPEHERVQMAGLVLSNENGTPFWLELEKFVENNNNDLLCPCHCKMICQGLMHLHHELLNVTSVNSSNDISIDTVICLLPLTSMPKLTEFQDKLVNKKLYSSMVKDNMAFHKPALSGYVYALCHRYFSVHLAAQFTQEGAIDRQGNVISHAWGNLIVIKLIITSIMHQSKRNVTTPVASMEGIKAVMGRFFRDAKGRAKKSKSSNLDERTFDVSEATATNGKDSSFSERDEVGNFISNTDDRSRANAFRYAASSSTQENYWPRRFDPSHRTFHNEQYRTQSYSEFLEPPHAGYISVRGTARSPRRGYRNGPHLNSSPLRTENHGQDGSVYQPGGMLSSPRRFQGFCRSNQDVDRARKRL